MNVLTRGVRNALRSPLRAGAVIIMLAASVSLMLAMLVARSNIEAKINDVKATTATQVTINPAGIRGGLGTGDYLSEDQITTIKNAEHIQNVTATLTDQLGTDDTNLTPSQELGNFGKRQLRFENREGASGSSPGPEIQAMPKEITPRITATGTNDTASFTQSSFEGETMDANSSENVALVGKTLATKNNLTPGSTFTAFGQTITVKGIYSTGNAFQDNGIVMPLKTLQTLSEQTGSVSSIEATVDSSDNVSSAVAALKSSLGDKVDVTSQEEQAKSSLEPLENIASLALTGVIGAAVAGAVIILLVMIIIVRERKREIGVIKAIGGTNAKVISQFIIEALTLTLIGGVIGLGVGIAISGPITQSLATSSTQSAASDGPAMGGAIMKGIGPEIGASLQSISSTVSPQVFATGLALTILIAIVGSAVPAWSIARVRPSEILRND